MSAVYPSLKGRGVLVTGGASGIGAGLVVRFGAQGARVAYVDLQREAGTALAEHLTRAGMNVRFDVLDVTDVPQLQRCLENIEETFGTIDVLVNNVTGDEARDRSHDWRSTTELQWRSALAVNLDAAFFSIQKLLPGMLQRRQGSIINVASSASKAKPDEQLHDHAAANGAIHGLTRAFRSECAANGVRINTVQTTSAEVVDLVLFLAADDSRLCNGQKFEWSPSQHG